MKDTKEKIHNAILHIIGEGKITNLKVADIAKQAGIGKSTVYEYFVDKNEAIMSAINSYCIRISEKYEIPMDETMNFDEAFELTCNNMFTMLSDYGDTIMLMISRVANYDFHNTKRAMSNLKEKYQAHMESLVKKGVAEGRIKSDLDIIDMGFAIEFMSIAIGSYHREQEVYKDLTRDEYIGRIRAGFLKLLN